MAKIVPPALDLLPPAIAGSGLPDLLRITRTLSTNGHGLYGLKARDGGWGTNRWNEWGELNVADMPNVTAGAGETFEVGRVMVPASLVGAQEVVACSIVAGDPAAGVLRFSAEDGTELTCALDPTGAARVRLRSGVWWVWLDSAESGSNTVTLRGLTLWYARKASHGAIAPWQPLAQDAFVADEPDDAYALQTLIQNQNHVACESSSVLFSRWFGLPWNASGTATTVGSYQVLVEQHVPSITIYLYARCEQGAGVADVQINASTVASFPLSEADGWKWLKVEPGDVLSSGALIPGLVNDVTIRARKTSSINEGVGVQVAGVYAWEQPCSADLLGLPGFDEVPANYRGNDAERMSGFFPALADLDGAYDAGTKAVNDDTIWLKSRVRRMLICDWLHRTAYAARPEWMDCGVSYSQTTYDSALPWREPNTSVTAYNNTTLAGSVLAWLKIPPGHLPQLEVWLLVSIDGGQWYGGEPEPFTWEIRVDGFSENQVRRFSELDLGDPEPVMGVAVPGLYRPRRHWLKFVVDRSTLGDGEILVRARCLNQGLGHAHVAALQLYGVAIREAPFEGEIP